MNCKFTDYGLVTTPQLHFIVMNSAEKADAASYQKNFLDAFQEF
jgi:hypothetical protein